MQAHLFNGEEHYIPVGGAFGGRQVTQVVLNRRDVQSLLGMSEDQRLFWLQSLSRRFVPELVAEPVGA